MDRREFRLKRREIGNPAPPPFSLFPRFGITKCIRARLFGVEALVKDTDPTPLIGQEHAFGDEDGGTPGANDELRGTCVFSIGPLT